jgi:AGZA family xanthine/uracil permease-like MFS transporter
MGGFARYPIALAPGMGLNAYFTYSVVKGMGIPWQTALGAVLISGVAFLLLTALGLRQLILNAIPRELYAAVAAGIGLFIALIGFRNSGIVAPSAATMVTLGNLADPSTALAIFGLIFIAALLAWRVRAAMLIGILTTTAVGLLTGIAKWTPQTFGIREMTSTFGKLDVAAALRIGFFEVIFVFLFVDLFDNLGTLVAVGTKAKLFDASHRIPRINRILFSDAAATVAGSLAGTSTVVSYVESAAGVAAGGRTGIPAVVAGMLFLAALFVAPMVGAIPAAATAPALILVGSMMVSEVTEIDWQEPEVAIPAFLTMMAIPLSFSIANGLAFGFIAYAAIKLLRGKFREVNWFVYLLAVVFVLRFIYLSA